MILLVGQNSFGCSIFSFSVEGREAPTSGAALQKRRQMPRWWCFLPLLWAVEGDHDEIGPGDMVVTHHENAGLQDGRHDRFPCTKQPEVIPWNRAHVFKINHEPYTNEKKACSLEFSSGGFGFQQFKGGFFAGDGSSWWNTPEKSPSN